MPQSRRFSVGSPWPSIFSPSASHLKGERSNDQQSGQNMHNYNVSSHGVVGARQSVIITQWNYLSQSHGKPKVKKM